MLIIKVRKGSRKDLGRPSLTPVEHKEKFMKYMKEN
jgi:phosphonopyruvate decarboxylase